MGGDGWFYVGSSQDLAKRESNHRSALRRGYHENSIMQRVFDKYGVFRFTILERCPTDQILEREQRLLDTHCIDPKCANMAAIVGPPSAGWKHSDESRKKMSASQTGLKKPPRSPEHRATMSAALTGRKRPPFTPEARANMSAAKKGKNIPPFTDQHCAALSAAQKLRRERERSSANS